MPAPPFDVAPVLYWPSPARVCNAPPLLEEQRLKPVNASAATSSPGANLRRMVFVLPVRSPVVVLNWALLERVSETSPSSPARRRNAPTPAKVQVPRQRGQRSHERIF